MAKLHSKQLIAAFQIAAGQDKKKAAKAAKVTPQTISQWLKEPAFEAKVNEYQLDCLNEAQARFKHLAGEAISTLETVLKNSKSEKAKLEAAKFILETIQILPGNCPAILTIGKTTETEIIRKRKAEKAKEAQSKMFEDNGIMGLSSYM